MLGTTQGTARQSYFGDVQINIEQKESDGQLMNQNNSHNWPLMADTKFIWPTKPLAWAYGMGNKLSMIPASKIHYVCMVAINDIIIEVIDNTSGACSLIDLRTARKLEQPMQLAIKYRTFSSFYGPNDKLV